MPTFDAGSIQATLELDRTQFNEELRAARQDGERFGRERFKAKLEVDAAGVQSTIANVRSQMASLRDVNLSVGVSGNTSQIQQMRQQMQQLSGESASMGVSVQTADAMAALRTLRQQVRALDGYTIRINTDVDTAAANGQLVLLQAQLRLLDGQTTNTTVGVNRMGGSMGMASGMMRQLITGAIIFAPALIPLTQALGGATASFTTLAVAGGGALAVFGGALFGAISNVNGLNKTLDTAKKNLDTQRAALERLKPGTDAYALQLKKVEEAQKDVNDALEAFTPSQRRFNTAVTGMKGAWSDFIKATSPYTLGVAKTAVEGITAAIPKMIPVVKAVTPEMQELAATWKGWVNDGGADRFFKFLITTGVPVLRNLRLAGANIATVMGNLFRAAAPGAKSMSDSMVRITGQMAKWSNEGGFVRFMDKVKSQSPAVKDFLRALGDALGNIYNAVSPLGMPMLKLLTIFLQLVAAIPPSWITAVYIGFMAWKGIMAVVAVFKAVQVAILMVRWAFVMLRLAMLTNPFGLILLGITLLIAGIVLIATKTTWFQTIWRVVWGGIKTAAMAVWNSALKPAFNGIKTALTAVGNAAVWLWRNAIVPAFNGIVFAGRLLITILGTIIFTPLFLLFKLFRWWVGVLWRNVWRPAVMGIAALGKWLWENALRPAFNGIMAGLRAVGRWAKWLWTNAIKPAWNAIKVGAGVLWAGVKIAFNHFVNGLKAIGRWGKWLWQNAIKPAFNSIADGAKWLWNKGIKPPLGWITGGFKTVGKWAKWLWDKGISPFWDKIKDGTTSLKNAMIKTWDKMTDGIAKAWKAVKKIAAVPINFVIREVYNGGVVKVWNKIADAVGLKKMKLGEAKEIKYARGGSIEGGMAGLDSVSVRAMPGEHLWTAEEVKNAGGHGAMAQMRAMFSGSGKARVAPGQGNASAPGHNYAVGSGAQGQKYDLGGAIDWVTDGAKGIGNALKGGVSSIGGAVSKGWDFLKDAARGAIGPIALPILKTIKGGVKKGVNAVIPGSPPWQDLAAGTATKPIDMLMDWISKDDATFGGGGGANVAKALQWAKSQEGKPYIWGGVGPKGYDCSGFMSAIQNVIDGKSPYNRRWATGAFPPGPKGWKRNQKAPFSVGITNAGVGHTAGTLAGTNVESRGGKGVVVGKGARGTKSGMFTSEWGYTPSMGGGGGSGRWSETVSAVLRELGVYSPGNLSNVLKAIKKESGGNPNAQNNWDINAKNGNPSKGLLQVIRTTFNAHAGKYRSRGQLDPYANIYAAVHYAKARYGKGWSARMARPGGYARGGVTVPGVHMVGENGPELLATGGGDRVFTAQESQRMLNNASRGGGGATIVQMPETITVRIGQYEFEAVVEGIADDRISAVIQEADGSR